MNHFAPTERLISELDLARLKRLLPTQAANPLVQVLDDGEPVAPQAMPADVVTMHSEVELRDLATHTLQCLKLCYPEQANPTLGFVSVLSPVGAALLGLRVGSVARWALPLRGERSARIERITFQPEAMGLYTV